jgi:AGZA family xanthine/uracil permease-like MFS transporter
VSQVVRARPWLVRGDYDGLFALGLDNLVMLLLMTGFCLGLLGLPPALYFGVILPANALGLVVGNLYYAWQARRLMQQEGRDDACALPYGINLLTVVVFSLGVMYPVKLQLVEQGVPAEAAALTAWQVGLLACVLSGLIELVGALAGRAVLRWTPRAALLAPIAAIAFFFIAADFFFRAFSFPLVALPTLLLVLVIYFGRMRFRTRLPGGLLVLALGTAIAWSLHLAGLVTVVPVGELRLDYLGLHLPRPRPGLLLESAPLVLPYLPVIAVMGFFSLGGSLMNLESAAAAGDRYGTRSSLLVNGAGSLLTGLCGSPFPTTLYIGHPGWKQLGARAGYSLLNGLTFALLLCSGLIAVAAWAIPVEAGMAILIWIGLVMLTQAMQSIPTRHVPAVGVGMLPALAAFSFLLLQKLWATAGGGPADAAWLAMARAGELWAPGILALNAGYLFTSLLWTAMMVGIIDRRFGQAACWSLLAALCSLAGLVHAWQPGPALAEPLLASQPGWAAVYAGLALLLWLVPRFMRPADPLLEP